MVELLFDDDQEKSISKYIHKNIIFDGKIFVYVQISTPQKFFICVLLQFDYSY